ncbi:MAG: hypothetical protein OET55_05770, partial [Desulfuromonadales bacterium]|nr:hypothetical protein [Desulfuromonadales bacterium]
SRELLICRKGSYLFIHLSCIVGARSGRNTNFLQTLINNKWPPGSTPSGHHLFLLNVSINKTAVCVSEVVTNKKNQQSED